LVNIPERKGINVIGFLDNSAVNTIVIGAHYDHLGLGHDHNSLDANPEDKIHNGADDNASGTSGVLELAKYFSENNVKENYNFLFICFSGEELGLLGSKKWCDNPTIDLTKINYMINMDMIGRLNDSTKKLLIYGVGTSPTWVPLLQKTNAYFSIKMDSSGIGPSDQTSFYLKDIPVLHFFTGQHSDYHKPTDDVEKINLAGEKKVLEYIVDLINQTNSLPKLTFAKTASPVSTKSKYKVTLGVMPDYTFEGTGMRIDGVTDNKPAFKAGIKTGDIIIELGGQKINNVQDYMKALSGFNKGDKTIVGVKRGNENLSLALEF
jgi:Zn-dependent M28 family amino/carboxypeptidase